MSLCYDFEKWSFEEWSRMLEEHYQNLYQTVDNLIP